MNLSEGEVVSGASGITQQLAKNLYLSTSRNPLRKVREFFIAQEQLVARKRVPQTPKDEFFVNFDPLALEVFRKAHAEAVIHLVLFRLENLRLLSPDLRCQKHQAQNRRPLQRDQFHMFTISKENLQNFGAGGTKVNR